MWLVDPGKSAGVVNVTRRRCQFFWGDGRKAQDNQPMRRLQMSMSILPSA